MRRISMLAFFLITTFVIHTGCAMAGDDPVLASVGNEKITMESFGKMIDAYTPEQRKAFLSNPNNKVVLLKRMAEIKALAMKARETGLDKAPETKMMVDYYTDEVLAQELIRKELAKLDVSEKDMKEYYMAHPDQFRTPEMAKARDIFIKAAAGAPEGEKKKAKEKAEDVLKRLKAGEDFAKVASEVSDDAMTKDKGGNLGFIPRDKVLKELENTIFTLKPGQISEVVETKYGFYIIKVEEKKEAVVPPFEEVKDKAKAKILGDMQNDKRKELVEQALKDEHAEIHPERLK
jgi:peptidyl-prolyl cis-trans isomerase C